MTRALWLLAGFVLALGGCATTLEPAPGTYRVGGVGKAAAASEAGVYIVAAAQAWRGFPQDLGQVVTPILVTIDNNNGTRRLSVRYNHLTLVNDAGVQLAALPPFSIEGAVSEPVPASFYPPPGFHVAPYLSGYYPRWHAFDEPFLYDPFYYGRYYPAFTRVQLPTNDMLVRALPEGVVDPGGRVSGFVYFERLPKHTKAVTFVATLVEAGTNATFGAVRIPFVAD